MIDNLYAILPEYLAVLHKIASLLAHTNVNWVVTGSLGFALQGVPIKVGDIDIQTDAAGAYEIERLFAEYVTQTVRFSSTERIRSHFGVLQIDGIIVELMGDIQKRLTDGTWEEPVDLADYQQFVEWEGMQIPVLSLEYEYQAYLKLGRMKKAQMLRRWLDHVVKPAPPL